MSLDSTLDCPSADGKEMPYFLGLPYWKWTVVLKQHACGSCPSYELYFILQSTKVCIFFSKFLVSKQNLELGDTHLNFGATVDVYLTP